MMQTSRSLLTNLFAAFIFMFILASYGFVFAIEYLESSNGLDKPKWSSGYSEIKMADINLDGNIDLVSIGDHGSPYLDDTEEHGIMVYFGNGRGTWYNFMFGNFGFGGIAVGDCNNDGLPDVGYAMHHRSNENLGDQFIEVAIGDGTGRNWFPWDDNLATHGETYGMCAPALGDVDNDGDLDIAAASFGPRNNLMIYKNMGNGSWEWSAALPRGPYCGAAVQFGDINNDGDLDLATLCSLSTVFFGNGDGTFRSAAPDLPLSVRCNGLSMGDIDNDGGMELACALSKGRGLKVWKWNSSEKRWIDFSGQLPKKGGFQFTQLYDMNADGFCDLVAAGKGRVEVWLGDGKGNWALTTSYKISNDPNCNFKAFSAGGDVDHNGYPDIVHLTDERKGMSGHNHLRLYKETTTAKKLAVIPIYPKGRERLIGGSVRFIDWLCAVQKDKVAFINLDFSSSGKAGPWTSIVSGAPNNGRHQWIVPSEVNSQQCFIRITAISGSDIEQTITPYPFMVSSRAAR